jgi:hypothetical protein
MGQGCWFCGWLVFSALELWSLGNTAQVSVIPSPQPPFKGALSLSLKRLRAGDVSRCSNPYQACLKVWVPSLVPGKEISFTVCSHRSHRQYRTTGTLKTSKQPRKKISYISTSQTFNFLFLTFYLTACLSMYYVHVVAMRARRGH